MGPLSAKALVVTVEGAEADILTSQSVVSFLSGHFRQFERDYRDLVIYASISVVATLINHAGRRPSRQRVQNRSISARGRDCFCGAQSGWIFGKWRGAHRR